MNTRLSEIECQTHLHLNDIHIEILQENVFTFLISIIEHFLSCFKRTHGSTIAEILSNVQVLSVNDGSVVSEASS